MWDTVNADYEQQHDAPHMWDPKFDKKFQQQIPNPFQIPCILSDYVHFRNSFPHHIKLAVPLSPTHSAKSDFVEHHTASAISDWW